MSDAALPGFRAVVPAGGAGTRLWPLSRAAAPKFLQDLAGTGRTMLQATVDRLTPLAGPGGVLVVTGAAHEPAVRAQLPDLAAGAVLAEPSARDSMAAIGLAAAVLAEREGDVVLGSFAADHVVRGDGFARAVELGVEVSSRRVRRHHRDRRDRAVDGLRLHRDRRAAGGRARCVPRRAFTEKPDVDTATAWLASGRYRWNAGMFLVRTDVLLGHLARLLPALHDGLRTIARAWDTPERDAVLTSVWPGLQRIAIDHAIAEPVAAAGGVAVVPGDFEWDDVGDVAALRDLLPGDPHVLGDAADVLVLDAPGSLVVPASGRLVALLGVPDLVVMDTADALLVTTRAQAQRVKAVVDALRERGRTDLL